MLTLRQQTMETLTERREHNNQSASKNVGHGRDKIAKESFSGWTLQIHFSLQAEDFTCLLGYHPRCPPAFVNSV